MRRLIFFAALLLVAHSSFGATYVSRATGNWNATATWAELRTGTITTNTASATVTGVGTTFTTQLAVGNILYTAAGIAIGTIQSITNNTTLTLTANAASTNAGIPFYRGATATPVAGDAVTVNSHAVTVNVASAATSLTVNGGGTVTQSNSLTLSGALSVAGTLNSTQTLSVGTGTTVSGALNVTATGGTHTFTGAVNISGTWNVTVNEPISIGNNLTNTGTFTSGGGTYTFPSNSTWSGAGGLTFAGGVSVSANADIINNTGVTVTGTFALGNGATMTNNNSVIVTGNLTGGNGASTWTNAAGSTLEAQGTLLTTGTLSAGASNNTVTYNDNGAQTVKLPVSGQYFDLVVSGGNTKTPVAGTYNVLNDLTINAGTTFNANSNDPTVNVTRNVTVAGTYTASSNAARPLTIGGDLSISGTLTGNASPISVGGNFTRSGTYTAGTGAFTFNGTGAQTITGATTFQNLTFNNTAGVAVTVRVADNVTVSGTLTMTSGKLDLDTDGTTLEVTSTCAGVTRTGGVIVGNLTLHYPTLNPGTTTCVFHIGAVGATAAGTYLPVTVAMTNVSSTLANSTLTLRTDTPDHAGVTSGAAGIDPSQSVNRYWTMTGGGSLAYLRHSTTFTFVAADVDAGAATAAFEVARLTGGAWFSTAPGTRTATTTQVLNENNFGVFSIGELLDRIYAEYRMEEAAGLLGAIADTSGNGRDGARLGAADTVLPSPTNPVSNICRGLNIPNNTAFGTISALDTGVDLNEVGQKGTITFWYKSTPLWNGGGDRQLLDASSSTSQAFSLYLPTNGRLTLTISDTTPTAGYVQTQNATSGIAANTWAHIGITWNFASATFQIFVNGVAVASTQTTPGGAPNGVMGVLSSLYVGDNRIGGLVGGVAGFNTPNSANGVIDEVRIYNTVRSAAQIAADRTASYPIACDVTAIPGRFNAFETSVASTSTTGSINTKVSGTNATVKLVAVNALHTAVDTTFAGTAKIEVLDATDGSGALDANKCRSSWTAVTSPAPTTVNATFVAGVSTPYTFVVPDAYRNLRLRISYPASAPVLIGCTTDNFAMRPASLSSITARDETWSTPYTTGTPRSLNNSGPVHKAGRAFTISATALNGAGSPAVTANYDGSPTVASTTLVQPSGAECNLPNPACVAGTLSAVTWSGSGTVSTASAAYSEVGVIQATFEDTTYANIDSTDANPVSSTSAVPASAAVTIGRFVPDHFLVAAGTAPIFRTFGVADASCGGTAPKRSFTYVGQDFNWQTAPSITITARSFGGGTTALYRGSLFKIAGSDISYTHSGNSGGATFVATPTTGNVAQNHNGTGTATAGADIFSYARPASPLAPFTASISMTMDVQDASEADGAITSNAGSGLTPVSFNSITFDGGNFSASLTGGKTFVYGRARLFNSYGPAQRDLPIDLRAEYYDGANFATNTKDNCTSLAAGNFKLAYPTGSTLDSSNLGSGHISLSGTFVSGLASLRITKPSPTPSTPGSATLCLDLDVSTGGDTGCQATAPGNKLYLQGPWGSAAYDKDPAGLVGFGLYGAPNNFIFFRENY